MDDTTDRPDPRPAAEISASGDRFDAFEYPNDDFPDYNGRPVMLSGPGWLLVLATVVCGFLALTIPLGNRRMSTSTGAMR
jgi:hypothetical protein